jgi:hypothetical protein
VIGLSSVVGTRPSRCSEGTTASKDRIATSIWSELGGLVVISCSHSPGFMTARTSTWSPWFAPSRSPS